MVQAPVRRIVLAYSGGLDTSAILRWPVQRHGPERDFKGRAVLIAYGEKPRIPVTATAEKPYSTDRNLLHVSYEGGILEDPWRPPYEDMFQLTVAPERAPDQAEDVDVDLEGGLPVAVNGERLSPASLLT